mgnify:CR=1 FL=1
MSMIKYGISVKYGNGVVYLGQNKANNTTQSIQLSIAINNQGY